MIISHKHRFVFVEVPHTGSHAVSSELRQFYGGVPIHKKHANLTRFLASATREEKQYFVFGSVRNPMDSAVTEYLKLVTNHKGQYTNPAKLIANGGYLTPRHISMFKYVQTGATFSDYFRKYRTGIYNNWFLLGYSRFNYIIRFEQLADEYERVIASMDLDLQRPLPVVNPTRGKDKIPYQDYYSEDVRVHAVRYFGPFMEKWGYRFPSEWDVASLSSIQKLKFELVDNVVNAAAMRLPIDPDASYIKGIKSLVDVVLR